MGKASRLKKEKNLEIKIKKEQQKPMMDPLLIEAYTRGRMVGERQGKIEGYEKSITMFHHWTEDIDQHVKGIGPKMKTAIVEYFSMKMQETIDKNKNNKN